MVGPHCWRHFNSITSKPNQIVFPVLSPIQLCCDIAMAVAVRLGWTGLLVGAKEEEAIELMAC